MHSKKLGRAAAAAGLVALLLPGAAFASWWDGGYDGRYNSGYDGRRGDSAPPRNEEPPESDKAPDYAEPEETPPQDGGPPPAEIQSSPGCGERDCGPPPGPSECGQPDCETAPPSQQCGQSDCDAPPASSECGPSGCTRYTPPPDDSPPAQCGQQGCERYTPPPSQCAQPDCGAPPPQQCGQPDCGAPPPPPECGQSACAQAPPPPPPPPLYEPIYGCENSTLSDVQFALHKKTSPPPGTPVRPGDEILVDITWDWWTFSGPDLHKAIDCVYINGLFVPELSGGERPTPNDGHFAFHYFVPLDVPPGSEICDQGFVSGPQGWEEFGRNVSNVVCFPVVAPPPPPPPPPPSTCCAPPPTCCTQPAEEETPPPDLYVDTESSRLSQEDVPPAVLPEAHAVLPRTGSDSNTARLAAAALATATLIGRRARRR